MTSRLVEVAPCVNPDDKQSVAFWIVSLCLADPELDDLVSRERELQYAARPRL